jgi:UDP-N-acetylmuramoyl-tripeptide--D-alanyl-D-alanine ligase
VNNAQREHQEFMGTVEATAHENGAVISALPQHGIAVFPSDDACAGIWRKLAGARQVLDFARRGRGKVTAQCRLGTEGTELSMATPAGSIELTLRLTGEHNIHNALAATAAALAVSVSPVAIQEGLESFTPVAGRGVRLRTASGAYLIDDTYNASPDSTIAALNLLADLEPEAGGRRIAVLGDMLELGSYSESGHRLVGARAANVADLLVTVGQLGHDIGEEAVASGMAMDAVQMMGNDLDAVGYLRQGLRENDIVLVKGSRAVGMDAIVAQIAFVKDGGGAP